MTSSLKNACVRGYCAPRLWKASSNTTGSIQSLNVFKKKIKILLFKEAFLKLYFIFSAIVFFKYTSPTTKFAEDMPPIIIYSLTYHQTHIIVTICKQEVFLALYIAWEGVVSFIILSNKKLWNTKRTFDQVPDYAAGNRENRLDIILILLLALDEEVARSSC